MCHHAILPPLVRSKLCCSGTFRSAFVLICFLLSQTIIFWESGGCWGSEGVGNTNDLQEEQETELFKTLEIFFKSLEQADWQKMESLTSNNPINLTRCQILELNPHLEISIIEART